MSDYMRRDQAAEYLKRNYGYGSTNMLAKRAVNGGGPVYSKVGPWPMYRAEDLDAWARSRISPPAASTAEHDANRQRSAA